MNYYKLKKIIVRLPIIFITLAICVIILGILEALIGSTHKTLISILTIIPMVISMVSIVILFMYDDSRRKLISRRESYKENNDKRFKLYKLGCDIKEANKYLNLMQNR